jgi:hypothetical protein
MSQFVRRLNQIKSNRTPEWLTSSQQEVLFKVKTALRVPSTINLFGHVGVGKTFLGWTLAHELNFSYLPDPALVKTITNNWYSGIILDNCRADRQTHRELLKILQFQEINKAVFISRQMIKDYTPFIELNLTHSDISAVRQNLTDAGMLSLTEDDVPNLWHLVNSSL